MCVMYCACDMYVYVSMEIDRDRYMDGWIDSVICKLYARQKKGRKNGKNKSTGLP